MRADRVRVIAVFPVCVVRVVSSYTSFFIPPVILRGVAYATFLCKSDITSLIVHSEISQTQIAYTDLLSDGANSDDLRFSACCFYAQSDQYRVQTTETTDYE